VSGREPVAERPAAEPVSAEGGSGVDEALQLRAIGLAMAYLPSAMRFHGPELGAVLAMLADCRADLLRARHVTFALPRPGFVQFRLEGAESCLQRCDLAGAQLAYSVLSLPPGSGLVLPACKPNRVRNCLDRFQRFVAGKGPAGRALAQAVDAIVVSSRSRTIARFGPRPGTPVVTTI
jgi:hypothetical protein